MPQLPRLSTRAEHLLLKGVCGLSPRTQRLLFGPPPSVDGLTLASDIHAFLKLTEMAGVTSYTGGLSPSEARVHNSRGSKATQPQPPLPMARVEAATVPGQGGPIPARLYVPNGLPAGEAPPLLVFYHGGGWVI